MLSKTNDYAEVLGLEAIFQELLIYSYERMKYPLEKALITQQQNRYTQRLDLLTQKYRSLKSSKPN